MGHDIRRNQDTPYQPRRELLSDAAITVLARDGGRGLTHRAVDREAELPEGTSKNYFPTREALLVAAAHRMADEHRVAVEALRATTPESVTPAQIGQLYPALLRRAIFGSSAQILAMLELYLEAVRRPPLRQVLGEMARTNAEAIAALHNTAGLPTTNQDAGVLDAYFLGVAISLLALPVEALRAVGLDDPNALGLGLFNAAIPKPEEPKPAVPADCRELTSV